MEAVKSKPKHRKKHSSRGRDKKKEEDLSHSKGTSNDAGGVAPQDAPMAPKSDHCLVKDNAEKLPEQVSASNIERKLDPTCNEVFDSRTKTEYEVIRESPSKTSSDAAVPFKSILRNQDSESTSHTVTNYQNVTANVSDSETKTLNNIVKQQQVDSRTELEHETDSVIKNRPVNTAEESSETTQIQSSLEVSRGHPVASTRVQSTSDQVRSDQSDTLVKLDTSSQNIAEKGKVTITPKLSKGSAADMTASELETKSLVPSAPVLIDLWETQDNTGTGAMMEEGRVCSVIYPKLESFLQVEERSEDLIPFTEEDLSILYPNPQLESNHLFIDNFIKSVNQERHELYDLLMTYLKTKQHLTNCLNQLEVLKKKYDKHEKLVWQFISKEISSTGKCNDQSKVSHSYSYKIAEFHSQEMAQVRSSLKATKKLLEEELCVSSYSSQLARAHVDHYLYRLMHSVPNLGMIASNAPVTSWVPHCLPGTMDTYCSHLRDSISILFLFERRPVLDKDFSEDCRSWLTQLISVLLRVASLADHQFLFNHLLRCPAEVGEWGAGLLQVPSPLQTKELLQSQFQHNSDITDYSHTWGVELGLHGDWGGPILDHFMMLLATLMLPIRERDSFLSYLRASGAAASSQLSRQVSTPWTFIDGSEEEFKTAPPNLLEESDYISFFNQFPFSDLFRYVLKFPREDDYHVEQTTSYQMLRLFAFGTCLIRLLGTAFSTLRLAKYKEFIKLVGQTIGHAVAFVADHWTGYRTYWLQSGDLMSTIPWDGGTGTTDSRYSLNRLQLEFDQFVLRATQWILIADKLGAWQFLADFPYGNISLGMAWIIFWNIYCKQSPNEATSVGGVNRETSDTAGSGGQGGGASHVMPHKIEEIQEAIRIGSHKEQFVDRLMKTYTSQAVFLLTTLVNMARARSCDTDPDEQLFINTVVLEIFECTHVEEYARDAYSKTGSHLLDSIAIVHPFVISTLLQRVETAVGPVGENCILLFKALPLHLWSPTPQDMDLIRSWLLDYQLSSSENNLARIILSNLNWGTKTHDGSNELVLPWYLHCSTALLLVESQCRHLPSNPGGRDYTPGSTSSLVGKYASRLATSSSQHEFVKWAWDVVLMLKLHPHQVIPQQMQTLSPLTSIGAAASAVGMDRSKMSSGEGLKALASARDGVSTACANFGDLRQPSWIQFDSHSREVLMPSLINAPSIELAELRDAVGKQGPLAYYVALCLTDIGTDTDRFIAEGLAMMIRLLDEGYQVAALKVLGNVTPRFFKHTKILLEDTAFIQIVLSLTNADVDNASLKENWVTRSVPMVTKKLAALIQTQLEEASNPMGIGGETVLKFWLDILFGCPNWYKEKKVLILLDTLCMAAFFKPDWTEALQTTLLEVYQSLCPIQPKKSLISSVYSSVASVVWQDGGTPSLYNIIPTNECSWLAFNALCAEQRFEEDKKIWRTLLSQLKKDGKITVENALKKSFAELKSPGSFAASHLCIYRWAKFCTTLSHTHSLYPLVWQRFFTLYLARLPNPSSPEREGFGSRFFASSQALNQRRAMKASLSTCCKELQTNIKLLEEADWADLMGVVSPTSETRDSLRSLLQKCIKFYQTLRLWLEEPRLHTASLYLPALPPQYDSPRLESIFQGKKAPWLEFVPVWKIKSELNSLVVGWMELAAYQKPLRCIAHSPQTRTDNTATCIKKRLLQRPLSSIPPPPFSYCYPPTLFLSQEDLMSRGDLVVSVCEDLKYILDQAKSFTSRTSLLAVLDEQYLAGVPELYANEPRQFHVRVPCRSRFNKSHRCSGPATIVFRFQEMAINSKWDTQLKTNRVDYDITLTALSSPVNFDLILKVIALEHTVAELSRLANQNASVPSSENIPLQNGITLFYEILTFVRPETRQFPPTAQFLSSCMQILGQTFIQQDPQQMSSLLHLILTEKGKTDFLAPLFHPNTCPQQFIQMYGLVTTELAVKEEPTVAFSILSKFNVVSWLESYCPSLVECEQLVESISTGLTLCGPVPSSNSHEILVDVYRRHLVNVIEHRFPENYRVALKVVVTGTENSTICVNVWSDLRRTITSPETPKSSSLGLQLIHESLDLLTRTYQTARLYSSDSLYSVVSSNYIPLIGQYLKQICLGMVSRWADDITMNSAEYTEAIHSCWIYTVGVFGPWILSIPSENSAPDQRNIINPCHEHECQYMKEMMGLFINCVAFLHSKLQDPHDSSSVLSLLWSYYCSSMALPATPHYIMDIYHNAMETLPWRSFYPDLKDMDSMMKLKLDSRVPPLSFVFLGRIFPLFDWRAIDQNYCSFEDSSTPLQFHIMFLQLLVMLTSERQVMENDETSIPQLTLQAQTFHWNLIDSKMFVDVLDWQKEHCDSSSILHKGSPLSLSLRLLRAAAGFPSSSGPRQQLHEATWEKRYSLMRVMVELVSKATFRKDIQNHSYSDCVSNLFQIAVDVSLHEPVERNSPRLILLMQEILNLLNISSSDVVKNLLGIMLDVFDQLPNAELISLPTITAACKSLYTFDLSTKIIEHAIECHFRSLTAPPTHPLELPPNIVDGYGWKNVTDSVVFPEDVIDAVVESGMTNCSVLLLHALLLTELPLCISIENELHIALKIMKWCSNIKPRPEDEAKLFLMWSKFLYLLLRQIQYSNNIPAIIPHMSSFAALLVRLGGDKANEGLLGVLGLGKRSPYSHRFRLVARSVGVFIQCQMPVDNSGNIQLRTVPNALGHVKDGYKANQPFYSIIPTKQAEQAYQSLESLLTNKHYSDLTEYIVQTVGFVGNPGHSILNCEQPLRTLCASLFPGVRYLDLIRVCQT